MTPYWPCRCEGYGIRTQYNKNTPRPVGGHGARNVRQAGVDRIPVKRLGEGSITWCSAIAIPASLLTKRGGGNVRSAAANQRAAVVTRASRTWPGCVPRAAATVCRTATSRLKMASSSKAASITCAREGRRRAGSIVEP
jgi:hypothetical protein